MWGFHIEGVAAELQGLHAECLPDCPQFVWAVQGNGPESEPAHTVDLESAEPPRPIRGALFSVGWNYDGDGVLRRLVTGVCGRVLGEPEVALWGQIRRAMWISSITLCRIPAATRTAPWVWSPSLRYAAVSFLTGGVRWSAARPAVERCQDRLSGTRCR